MEYKFPISVLMPVYNAEKYLKESICSILNQTYGDFEFLIINDGSTDKSEEIILSFKDERIVYHKNESNIKLIATLNKGIALARGKYIARMDADDISLPDRLLHQVASWKSILILIFAEHRSNILTMMD
jgi:glycosyltransferase involved in cell wall biosynthesis